MLHSQPIDLHNFTNSSSQLETEALVVLVNEVGGDVGNVYVPINDASQGVGVDLDVTYVALDCDTEHLGMYFASEH